MVRIQRCNLLDNKAPTVGRDPAAVPAAQFIDHTHSNAVLALTDQPTAKNWRATFGFGKRAALVPYIMPGLRALGQEGERGVSAHPDVEGRSC